MQKTLKTILVTGLLLFLLASSAYFFWQNRVLKQANDALISEMNKGKPAKMSLNDFYLYSQKTKALEQVVESAVYYAARVSKVDEKRVQVDFYLLGGEQMKVDAADLSFNLDPNLELEQISKGDTFINYPRLFKTSKQAVVTGVASIAGNNVLLGEANKIFATALIRKINPQLSSRLIVDLENTKAYLKGEAVLNHTATVKEIQL